MNARVGFAVIATTLVAVIAACSDRKTYIACTGSASDCSCGVEGTGGALPASASVTCKVSPADTGCCAEAGWPATDAYDDSHSGATCSCAPRYLDLCYVDGDFCVCGPGFNTAKGHKRVVSCAKPTGGHCCRGKDDCYCASSCFTGDTEADSCTATGLPRCKSNQTSVDDCRKDKVPASSSSSSSSSSGSSGGTCSSKGSCGPSSINCNCGTTCIHLGPGRYTCGFDCSKDSDCVGKRDPESGTALTSCS